MRARVVIDTSTLVSAILLPDSVPDRVLRKALAECELCASPETFAELKAVLGRSKFDRYAQPALRQKFIDALRLDCRFFSVPKLEGVCRDADDDKFLALALTAQAGLIVSSDDDLLALHPWRGIPIITPGDFLTRLQPAIESPENE